MKSVASSTPQVKLAPTYPRLMYVKSSGVVHLMIDATTGIVVNSGRGGLVIGQRYEGIQPGAIEDYDGTITLSNS